MHGIVPASAVREATRIYRTNACGSRIGEEGVILEAVVGALLSPLPRWRQGFEADPINGCLGG
jgi:hypothetical protein